MSSVVIAGDTSGTVTLAAPAVAGTTTLTLPSNTGNIPVVSGTGTSGQVLTSGGSGAISTWSTISSGATTLKYVTDTTDITLPVISSSYSTIGSTFSTSIPTTGLIRIASFAGKGQIATVADYANLIFGIRISSTNYWFSKYDYNGTVYYTGMTFGNGTIGNYFISYGGQGRFDSIPYNSSTSGTIMDISTNSIPTGTQTVQLIAAYSGTGYTGGLILKGTTHTTRVGIEFVSAS